jgi:aminoglycoside phosphotransferase (APT) family kinase protein
VALDEDKAAALLAACLDEGPWRVRPFGAGRFSDVFAAEAPRGRYVLRVAPPDDVRQLFYEYRMMRQEPAIHDRLLAETSVPAPPIAAHDFSRSLIDRDFLVMPMLPGEPLSRAALDAAARARALRQWGGYVAQIHGLTDPANRFGYLGEHRCMDPQPTWADAFAVMYRKELDDIVDCGIYDQATAAAAMELLEQHLGAFAHCRTSRLLHGDLWTTNLLVRGSTSAEGGQAGEVTGVLDFDRACWGDVEWDLAIAEYCGVTQPAFWEGYVEGCRRLGLDGPAAARDRIDTPDGRLRRMFYLLYEHQKYIVIRMSSRHDDPAGARRYARDCLGAMDRFRRTGAAAF